MANNMAATFSSQYDDAMAVLREIVRSQIAWPSIEMLKGDLSRALRLVGHEDATATMVADLESRVRFYEQHTDKQANELVEVTIQRDKWLAAFNRSEQFQNGPTKGGARRSWLFEFGSAQDKAAAIDAIHALLATLEK
jgi:hypothetical protein